MDTTDNALTVRPQLPVPAESPGTGTTLESVPLLSPVDLYLQRLGSPESRRTAKKAIRALAAITTGSRDHAERIPWERVRSWDTAAIRSELQTRYAPATANLYLSVLRGVLEAAWELGTIPTEDYQRAVHVKAVPGDRLPSGRALSTGEISALFAVCAADDSAAGARDAALLGVLYAAGLRRSEAAALTLEDYDPESGALAIHQTKGNKERRVYLTDGSRDALADWLTVRGSTPGALFAPVNKGGAVQLRGMTSQGIYSALLKRAGEAHVSHFSPHDLRRTMIGDLLEAGADLATVQKLAGHASVTTTAAYDRRGEAAKQKAASLLHVPYRRRIQR